MEACREGTRRMKTLEFDGAVYDRGDGRILRLIMNLTLPGLALAALEMALINSGVLKTGALPEAALKLIGFLTVAYVMPSVFVFPTAWFLSSGKTRLYRHSTIDLYKKKLVYHKAISLTMGKPRCQVYSVTQLRRVEEKPRCYLLRGTVVNETTGLTGKELKIPVAFENMHWISEMARYHR